MKKYKAILFDLDDTLWDCHNNMIEAFEDVYNFYKLDNHFSSFSHFMELYTPNNVELWKQYNKGLIGKEKLNVKRFSYPFLEVGYEDKAFINAFMKTYFDIVSKKTKLIDGAKELLDYLSVKYPLYIISNGFTEMQYLKLVSGGISSYFKKVFLSDELGVNKPDKRIFEMALSVIGVSTKDAIMIGDNYDTDILGAMNADIDQIYYNPKQTIIDGVLPNYVVTHLLDVQEIL